MGINLTSFIHPVRTYLPCSGAGRHMNNTILSLNEISGVNQQLFFASQWLNGASKLPENCPLRDLKYMTFPMPERITERFWKATGFPKMDRWIPKDTDWVYAPMETVFPTRKYPVAITIYDLQAFETDLEWSNTSIHRKFRSRWEKWIGNAIKYSRIIFTISEFSKSRIIELLKVDPDKVINVGCGVEQPFYDIAGTNPSDLSRPVNAPYVFMVGGLRQKKGGDYLLATAKELLGQKSDIQVVIAGPNDPDYEARAKELSNMHLLGMVPDDDLPALMRGSVGLLFLSLYEGFGIPPLESMASGSPAIVSDRASLPEVVGDAGVVVDINDIPSIVDLIVQLDKNEQFRQEYVQKGLYHLKKYSWDITAEKILNAFKKHS